MKESKNETVLTKIVAIDNLQKLSDNDLRKIATDIATTINLSGLRRYINYTLSVIVGATGKEVNTNMNDEQKLALIKVLLSNQKIIETNVRYFRRKTQVAVSKENMISFIKCTEQTLKTVKSYQPVKEQKQPVTAEEPKKTVEVKEVKPTTTKTITTTKPTVQKKTK